MGSIFVLLLILVVVCFGLFFLYRGVSVLARARARAKEQGTSFSEALSEVRAEEKTLSDETVANLRGEMRKTVSLRRESFDPGTGEVYESKPRAHKNSLEEWENTLVTLWEGNLLVEFTYQSRGKPKERRKVELYKVVEDARGDRYFYGYCQKRRDCRHFNTLWFQTMVLHKGRRLDVDDFMYEILDM